MAFQGSVATRPRDRGQNSACTARKQASDLNSSCISCRQLFGLMGQPYPPTDLTDMATSRWSLPLGFPERRQNIQIWVPKFDTDAYYGSYLLVCGGIALALAPSAPWARTASWFRVVGCLVHLLHLAYFLNMRRCPKFWLLVKVGLLQTILVVFAGQQRLESPKQEATMHCFVFPKTRIAAPPKKKNYPPFHPTWHLTILPWVPLMIIHVPSSQCLGFVGRSGFTQEPSTCPSTKSLAHHQAFLRMFCKA